MAKITIPSEDLNIFRTIANTFTFRERKERKVISSRGIVRKRTPASQAFVEEIDEAYNEAWRILSEGEKESWDILGAKVFTTGFSLFMRESFKSSTQSVYDYAVYAQNIYMIS